MLVVDSCQSDSTKKMPFIRRKRNHSASVPSNQIEAEGLAWLCFAEDHSWFQGNILTDDELNYSLYGRKVCTTVKEEEKIGDEEDDDNDDDSLEEKLEQLIIRTNAANTSRHNHPGSASSSCSTSSSCEELESIEEELNNNDLPKGIMVGSGSKKSSISSTSSSPSKVEEYYNVTLTDHFSGLRYELPKITVNNNREERGDGEKIDLFVCADGQVSFEIENIFKGQKADMMIQRHLSKSLLGIPGKKFLVYHGTIKIVFKEIAQNCQSWCL